MIFHHSTWSRFWLREISLSVPCQNEHLGNINNLLWLKLLSLLSSSSLFTCPLLYSLKCVSCYIKFTVKPVLKSEKQGCSAEEQSSSASQLFTSVLRCCTSKISCQWFCAQWVAKALKRTLLFCLFCFCHHPPSHPAWFLTPHSLMSWGTLLESKLYLDMTVLQSQVI